MLLSLPMLLVISVISSLLLGVAAYAAWCNRRNTRSIDSQLRYTAARQAELVLLAENQQQLLDVQQVLEGSIEGTTATVRAIHKGIAAIPFSILEAIPVTRDTTRVVRETHDFIADVVYSGISAVNKTSGNVMRKGIGEIDE